MPEKRTEKRNVSPVGTRPKKARCTPSSRHSFQSIPWENISLVPNSEGFLPGLKRLLVFLKDVSKADAIAVRIQEGNDFPFYFSRGFSRKFVHAENHLCKLDDQGNAVCDKIGSPFLECVCGFVLRKRPHGQQFGFSRRGSFLSGSREEFQKIMNALGETFPLRGRCHSEGFQTIGLIPLRRGRKTVGLIKFNWYRTSAITWENFLHLEKVGMNVAHSLIIQEKLKSLHEVVQYHHQIEESHGELVARLLPDGTVSYANPQMRAMFEEPCGPLFGQKLVDRVFPADRLKFEELLNELSPNHSSGSVEVRVPVDGTLRWLQMQITAVFDRQASFRKIQIQGRDVTGQIRLEKGLRETLHMLDGVFRKSPLPIFALDRHGLVMLWNPSAERVFGYQAAEMVGANLPFSDPARESEFLEQWRLMVGEAVSRSFSIQLNTSDGRFLDVVVSTGILRDECSDPAGGVCICWDFDEATRPHTRGEVWESQLVRIHRMEALGRFAGGIAHDFNGQLTTIFGYCDLLLEENSLGSKGREWVKDIQEAASRSSRLTEKMLAFSRSSILRPELVQLNEIIENLEATFLRTIPDIVKRDLTLEKDLGPVFSDPALCEQTIIHLILNAVDAMPDGGRLSIQTRTEIVFLPLQAVQGMILPGNYVIIEVADTGAGIEKRLHEKIFQPFFTTKGVGQGTGLGLSMVIGFMQQSGGSIILETAPGKGTRFQLFFPLIASDRVESLEKKEATIPEPCTNTVLIGLEDNCERDRLLQRLRSHGYRALAVSRADLVIEFSRKFRESIGVALIDEAFFQSEDSLDLIADLSRIHSETRVVVIASSEGKSRGSKSLRSRLPPNQVIERPFSEEDVVNCIEKLFGPPD